MLRDERRGGGFARKTQVILGLLAVAMLSVATYVAETRGSPMSLSALGSAVRGRARRYLRRRAARALREGGLGSRKSAR